MAEIAASLGARSEAPATPQQSAPAGVAACPGVQFGGRYPGGGFFSSAVPVIVITKNTAPSVWNVARQPTCATSEVATGPMIADPAP